MKAERDNIYYMQATNTNTPKITAVSFKKLKIRGYHANVNLQAQPYNQHFWGEGRDMHDIFHTTDG